MRYYLSHETERARMAERAHQRVIDGRNTYRDRLEVILSAAKEG
jgi:spore maturation protein CgeB